MGRNMNVVNPPGEAWMSAAACPVPRNVTSSLSLHSPGAHFFVVVCTIPCALCESLSDTRSLTNRFVLGFLLLQSLAPNRSNSFAASGASLESIAFFFSAFLSARRWEAVIAVRLSVIAFFKLFSLRDFCWRLPRRLELDKADDSDDWGELELLGLGESQRLVLRLRLFRDGERLLEGLLLDPRLLWLDLNRDLIDLEREHPPGGSCLDAEEFISGHVR
jgi:hypothetical protein